MTAGIGCGVNETDGMAEILISYKSERRKAAEHALG
jgi:hypothetical protein